MVVDWYAGYGYQARGGVDGIKLWCVEVLAGIVNCNQILAVELLNLLELRVTGCP
jgi:hypothetical protein